MCGKSVVNVFGGSFVNFQVNFLPIILDIGFSEASNFQRTRLNFSMEFFISDATCVVVVLY